jgi:hypothetical protein
MRLPHPLLLASFGVLVAAASCTLITDVDRSKIPDGVAGAPGSAGDGNLPPSGGGETGQNTGGAPEVVGGAGGAGSSNGGAGPGQGGADGGVANGGASLGGADTGSGGSPDLGAGGSAAGAGGAN